MLQRIGIFSIILIYILFGFIGILQPPMGDDFINLFNVKKIGILGNTLYWYENITGRFIYMFFNSLIAYNKLTFALSGLLSSILLFINVYLICYLVLLRKPKIWSNDQLLFLIVTFTVWFIPHCQSDAIFWKAGMIYALCSAAMLLFCIPYIFYFNDIPLPRYSKYTLIFVGILCGNGIEQVLIVIGYLFLFISIYNFRKFGLTFIKNIPIPLWLGVLGLIIGFIPNLLSPGSWNRYGNTEHYLSISDFIIKFLIIFLKYISFSIVSFAFIFTGLFFINRNRNKLNHVLLYITPVFLTLIIFVFNPDTISNRIFWIPYLIFIIGMLYYFKIREGINLYKGNLKLMYIVIIFSIIISIGSSLANNIYVYGQFIYREETVAEYKKQDKKEILLLPYRSYNDRVTFLADINTNPRHWQNYVYAKYCEVDSIKAYSVFTNPNKGIRTDIKNIFRFITH